MNLKDNWTLSLVRQMWPHMGLRSILRFREFSLREERGELRRDRLLALGMKRPSRQTVFLRESGSDILMFNEVLLEEVYRPVVEHVPDCRTVIDLGANIGLATLYLAARYPSSRVFAVEPHAGTYGLLRMNVEKLVREGRCRTWRGAVWGSARSLVADLSRGEEHYSAFAAVESEGAAAEGEPIEGLPIRELIGLAGFEQVDLVKVDIEGAEVELFKGDLDWLRQVNAIAIEFHGDSRAVTRFDGVMRDYGFRVLDDNPHTTLAVRGRP